MSATVVKRTMLTRRLAWAGLAVLVVSRVAIAVGVNDPRIEMLLADVFTYLLPALLAGIACAVIAWRVNGGVERRFWGLLSAATLLLLVSEAYWTWYAVTVDLRGPPMSSPTKYVSVLAALLYGAMIVSMTRMGERAPARRARFYLDVLAAMTIAYVPVYVLWTLPNFAHVPEPVLAAAWGAAWPVFGAAMLVGVVAIMAGLKAYLWRPWERLVAVSNSVFASGLIMFPVWYPQLKTSDAHDAGWYGLVLGAGLYLLFVASVYRVTASDEESLAEAWPVPRWRWQGLGRWYPVAATAALPVIGLGAYLRAGTGTDGPLLGAAIVLAVLLAARSWLAALEMGQVRLSAVTDPLTGAYNVRYLHRRLDALLSRAVDAERPLALVLVDVSDSRRIRRVFGGAAGNQALKHTANAVGLAVGPQGDVFRLTGDELAVLLPGADASRSREVASAVLERLDARRENAPHEVAVAVAVGAASFPEHAMEADGLLAAARAALAQARASDGDPVAVFSPQTDIQGAEGDRTLERRRALRIALQRLAATADGRDPETRHHSTRTAEFVHVLSSAIGIPEPQRRLVEEAALVHDIGKVGLSERVLRTSGRLASEQMLVDRHAEMGASILHASGFAEVAEVVLCHHERWDGAGSPGGLAGEDIPLESRMLAICSSFEEDTAGSIVQPTRTVADALAAVLKEAGTRFDPELASIFSRAMRERLSEGPATAAP